jgi:hypothetical protein
MLRLVAPVGTNIPEDCIFIVTTVKTSGLKFFAVYVLNLLSIFRRLGRLFKKKNPSQRLSEL